MHTWQAAAQKWLFETAHKKDYKADIIKIRILSEIAPELPQTELKNITRETIYDLSLKLKKDRKSSTVNRYLALIRAILRRAAQEWLWIEKAPFVRLLHEPKNRVRYLDISEAKTLLDELPHHQKNPMIFALATGLRSSNICNLKWSQVNLKRRTAWFHADEMKNANAHSVSLNDNALAILYACRGVHPKYVFTYQGQPLKRITTRAWYKALERAGIKDFRFHDLRHTWASWLAMRDIPLYTLKELGGWKSYVMVQRYAHLSASHNLEHVKKIDEELSFVTGLLDEPNDDPHD